MSSSSAEPSSAPPLSIVVGSNGATEGLEACLAALEPQVDGAEVLVCEPEPSPPALRARFPFEAHECLELPGDNAAYRRDALERTRSLYRDGFWEPEVNRRLRADGVRPWHAPELVVRQGRSAGLRAFTRQRLVHGRAHGRLRGARFGPGRNVAGILGAPLVPPLMTGRILRELGRRRRHRARALAALPLVLWFNAVWAAGEAAGHLDVLRGR